MKNVIGNRGFVSSNPEIDSLTIESSNVSISGSLQVTGSANITGSLFVTGSTNLTGSLTIDNITGKQYPFKDLWDDLLGSISDGNLGKGSAALTSEEYRDTGFLMFFLRHNQDDTINIVYQMPHMWDATTAVRPHMHIIPMAAGAGNLYIEYQYAWAPFDIVLGAIASWTTGSVTVPITLADQYKHRLISIGNITPPAEAGPSTMLLFKTTRAGTNPLDTYSTNKTGGTPSANVGILYLDLHYQKVRAGTETPGSYD